MNDFRPICRREKKIFNEKEKFSESFLKCYIDDIFLTTTVITWARIINVNEALECHYVIVANISLDIHLAFFVVTISIKVT